MSTHYNYIFTGAGAAGLSLLTRMLHSGKFRDKKILVIEQSSKTANDRTWCFWERGKNFFEDIVSYRYSNLWFYSEGYAAMNDISPYQYKLLKGIDFYNYCLEIIRNSPNVEWVEAKVDRIDSMEAQLDTTMFGDDSAEASEDQPQAVLPYALVTAGELHYTADYVFNSIIFEKPQLNDDQYWLLQHFKGWVIETEKDVFDVEAATLMDFRVSQQHGTTFVYVIPFASNKALVEYTLFTPSLLEQQQYDDALKNYIAKYLKVDQYKIEDEEFGVIPMTNYPFEKFRNRIVNIGTAGGHTKASTGYTFQFVQRECTKIIDALDKTGTPYYEDAIALKRFNFYDSTLLNILYHNKLEGSKIFSELFRRNPMTDVLQFLDNDTTILQELKLISVLPKGVFAKAALEQLF